MRNFNFLSKSSSQSCGHSSVTLASTVGSPSAHRRGAMLKLLSVLVLIFTFGIGQMWGTTGTLVSELSGIADGKTYYIAALNSSKYYTVPNTTISGQTFTCTEGSLSGSTLTPASGVGEFVFTAVSGVANAYYIYNTNLEKYLVATGSKAFGYVNSNSSNYGYWTFTTVAGGGFSGAFSVKHSNKTHYMRAYSNTVKCYDGTSNNGVYFFEKASCSNSVTISTGTPTNATISVSSASVATCSSTSTDRQVTVSVAPSSCYAAPVASSVTKTGTAASNATRKSGPTWNSTTQKYDYVFEFDQNTSGAISFNISLSTKTTYTVNFNKGNATGATGDASSDSKTCGEALTLPNSALFTRTGYTQQGWSTAQAGTTKTYNLGGSYTTDAATTLFPYWQANSYSVTWKVNNTNYSAGGSTSVNHDSHIASLPTAPNPASYCGDKFVGWTTDAEYVHGSSPLYTTASQFPNATTDQVFYAVFADYAQQ